MEKKLKQPALPIVPSFADASRLLGQILIKREADLAKLRGPISGWLAIDVMPTGLPGGSVGHHDEPLTATEGGQEVRAITLFHVFHEFAAPD